MKNLIENFLCLKPDLFSQLKRSASEMGDQALEDHNIDRIIQKDYYDLKCLPEPFQFSILPDREDAHMGEEGLEDLKVRPNMQSVSSTDNNKDLDGDKKESEKSSEDDIDAKLSQPTAA